MSIATVFAYLVGRRKAILQVAATPGAAWLGLLLVLSAGFAREYDGEDLLAEPWHLLLPLGASLILSFVLFCLVWSAAWCRSAEPPPFLRSYTVFLRLFWMTAPLVWLYAIPVERFCSAGEAVCANIYLLGIVSLWRVLLMIRVTSVLFGAGLRATSMLVLLFADSVALIALYYVPLPVVSIMGGIRLTESEGLIQSAAFLTGFFGGLSWPIWLLGTCAVCARRKKQWKWTALPDVPRGRVSPGLWLVAALSLVVWCGILPYTQPEQQLRHQAEKDLRNGRLTAAIALMSNHRRREFPRHWDPPPRIGYRERTPPLLDVLEAVCKANASPWVETLFLDKLADQLQGYAPYSYWYQLDADQRDRLLAVLATLPGGVKVVGDNARSFEQMLEWGDPSPGQIAQIRVLLKAAGHEVEPTDADSSDDLP